MESLNPRGVLYCSGCGEMFQDKDKVYLSQEGIYSLGDNTIEEDYIESMIRCEDCYYT